MLDNAPAHMKPALGLMMFTGLSPKDALKKAKLAPDGNIRGCTIADAQLASHPGPVIAGTSPVSFR